MSAKPSPAADLFWECAAELLVRDGVEESTMFGFRCLRMHGQFVGMPADDQLWVKLPEQRVSDLIDSRRGQVCAPNGRPFREWVKIAELDEQTWSDLLAESIEFVNPK